MSKAIIFIQEGFEEIEAFATIDILRRGGVDLTISSITDNSMVISSRGVTIKTDIVLSQISSDYDMLILPGGPGTANFKSCKPLLNLIEKFYSENKYLSGICAAPTIFGMLGILKDKTATCFPSCEGDLKAKNLSQDNVVTDGKITTSRGPATAIPFALKILELLEGKSVAEEVKIKILY